MTIARSLSSSALRPSHNRRRPGQCIDSSTRSLPNTRSVRFSSSWDEDDEQDEHQKVEVQIFEPTFHLTADELNNIWWSQEELDESCYERNETLREIQKSNNSSDINIRDSFSTLYKSCHSSLSISQVMRTKAAKDVVSAVVASSSDGGNVRGLETKLSKWVSQRRKLHAQSVVEYCRHSSLEQDSSIFFIDTSSKSSSSTTTSRASELVARILAHADALSAKSI